MHYNAILSVLAAGTSLISISAAAPLQTRQSAAPQCPAGTQYYDYETTSGFKGCTSTPAKYSSGPRVYWGNCPPNHGNWYVCANGFKGCNTDSTVCDSTTGGKPCPWGQKYYDCSNGFKGCSANSTVCDSTHNPTPCPWGQKYYVCSNGFKGCSADSTVCDSPTPGGSGTPSCTGCSSTPSIVPTPSSTGCSSMSSVVPTPSETPCPTQCPSGQKYYVCATGFKGCSAVTTVCDPVVKGPIPEESTGCECKGPVDTVIPDTDNNKCPKGTRYADYTSTTGFKGCTSTPEQFSTGERKYWSSCPPAHGNWYVCANGFSGCNTNVNVCGLKA